MGYLRLTVGLVFAHVVSLFSETLSEMLFEPLYETLCFVHTLWKTNNKDMKTICTWTARSRAGCTGLTDTENSKENGVAAEVSSSQTGL